MANLFDSHRSTVITIYTGAFDTSAAVCLVIKVMEAPTILMIFFSPHRSKSLLSFLSFLVAA